MICPPGGSSAVFPLPLGEGEGEGLSRARPASLRMGLGTCSVVIPMTTFWPGKRPSPREWRRYLRPSDNQDFLTLARLYSVHVGLIFAPPVLLFRLPSAPPARSGGVRPELAELGGGSAGLTLGLRPSYIEIGCTRSTCARYDVRCQNTCD
jgi:hypothetical protein